MNTKARKLVFKSILKNPLAEKLESKHKNSVLKLQSYRKSNKLDF